MIGKFLTEGFAHGNALCKVKKHFRFLATFTIGQMVMLGPTTFMERMHSYEWMTQDAYSLKTVSLPESMAFYVKRLQTLQSN